MSTKIVLIVVVLFATTFAQKCTPTGKDILGPYYQAGAPNKTAQSEVCAHSPAYDRLIITGYVKDENCNPLPNTKLDIWQANEKGVYSPGASGSDFTCRSVIYTDNAGRFKFTTIFPGRYDDDGYRPAHIHFIVTTKDPKFKPFTTQLYFKKDAYLYPHDSCQHCNSKDPTLVAEVIHLEDIKTYVGKWDIVLSSSTESINDEVGSGSYIEIKDSIMPSGDVLERLIKELVQLKKQQNKL
jgi:protocatechuate 3,4-dioxygenase beta subunit